MSSRKDVFNRTLCEQKGLKENDLSFLADEDSGFYELCQKYLEIPLKAPKFTIETGQLACVYQFTDIEIAKNATIEYIKTKSISNIEAFIKIIEVSYEDVSVEDTSGVTGFDIDIEAVNCPGYPGILFSMTQIAPDVFEIISDEILEAYK